MKTYPIENLTEKEQVVFTAITFMCFNDYCADLADVVRITGLDQESAKGVVGSLTKKNHVAAVQEKRGGKMFFDLHAVFGSEFLCWGDESGNLSPADFAIAEQVRDWKQES